MTKLRSGQEMLYKNQSNWEQLKNGARYNSCALHVGSLPATCIPRLKWFGSMASKLHSGQEKLYKNQSKGNSSKTEQGRVMVLEQCTSSHC